MARRMMTIFVDASVCHRTGAAGWGAWARCDGWTSGRIFSGELKARYGNSTEAEAAAIANALHLLSKAGDLEGVAVILVQSDSMQALDSLIRIAGAVASNHADGVPLPIAGKRKRFTPTERIAPVRIRETIGDRRLLVRHVRGHREGGARQWVNRACDEAAKGRMRAVRDEIEREAA